jgi:isoflavone/4'-methoxyisoflavone 2'-hydroxylase
MVVVSSPSIAEECLTKNNDIVFANRPNFVFTKHFAYNNSTLGASPYGDHWRNLRRVTTIHIFSSLSVQRSSNIRTEEIRLNVQKLFSNSNAEPWKEVNLTSLFQNLVRDVGMRMVCGNRWSSAADVFKAFSSFMNMCDFIPILRWIGFGGVVKNIIKLQTQRDKFLQDLIDKERKNGDYSCRTDEERKTIVQELLSLQKAEPEYYTDEVVKGMILVSSLSYLKIIVLLNTYGITSQVFNC